MKKLGLAILLVGLPLLASPAEVDESRVSARLCNSWYYNFDIRAYTCRFLTSYVDLVEQREYERTIGQLDGRIKDLERKIDQLEK